MEPILFLYAFCIAVFAVVYRIIIADEAILNWWFRFGLRFEKRFFYRPIWGCEKCFAGQIAFWVYLCSWVVSYLSAIAPISALFYKVVYIPRQEYFNVFSGVVFVSVTIFFTVILSKLYQRYLIN